MIFITVATSCTAPAVKGNPPAEHFPQPDTVLANTTWKSEDGEIWTFKANENDNIFTLDSQKGNYTVEINEKGIETFRDMFEASPDRLKKNFNKKTENINNTQELGLCLMFNDNSDLHEYYVIKNNDKMILARIATENDIEVLTLQNN